MIVLAGLYLFRPIDPLYTIYAIIVYRGRRCKHSEEKGEMGNRFYDIDCRQVFWYKLACVGFVLTTQRSLVRIQPLLPVKIWRQELDLRFFLLFVSDTRPQRNISRRELSSD